MWRLPNFSRGGSGLLLICGSLFLLLLYLVLQYQLNLTSHPNEDFHLSHLRLHQNPFVYPPPWTIVDIPLQYLINTLICPNSITEPIFLLVLITSHPKDFEVRQKLREILPRKELRRLKMRRLFLLGRTGSNRTRSPALSWPSVSSSILQESSDHHDILLGDFFESYHNLTYKHLMGLDWATKFCPQATFLLKQDDDIIVDYLQLVSILRQGTHPLKNLIWGKLLPTQEVIRDPKSKWFVPREEFPEDFFPPFVSGWAYVTTVQVAKELVEEAQKRKYFWIDDAHITGTLRERRGIGIVDMSEQFTTFKGQLQCCVANPKGRGVVRRPYWCDFLVGPNMEDLELMEIFQRHSRFCQLSGICGRREGKNRLNYTCVVTDNMVVDNIGHFGIVNKTEGKWKSISFVNKLRPSHN